MGIPTLTDPEHHIAHNKILLLDGTTTITGSFNFTTSAEDPNAENLLIIQDKDLTTRYTENFNLHKEHSREFQGKK